MAAASKDDANASTANPSPGRLSRDLIIRTALEQIDATGAHGLSMRSLAHELGVEAMSLYRYVRGKEDLLEGVVDLLMNDLLADLDAELAEHWQGFLQTIAHRVRRIAVEHPNVFPLVATRPPEAPWLRPPLRSVEVVNAFLAALIARGFSDQQAVDAYRSFSSFLLGQLLLESATRGAPLAPVSEPLGEEGAASPSKDAAATLADVPEVRRLRDMLSVDRSDEEFEVSLEVLLDRIHHEVGP